MEHEEVKLIYDEFLKYFQIEEIVSPGVFNKYKHKGKKFFLSRFDPRLLAIMAILRKELDKSITINNWKWGGSFTQRGLRDTSTPMVQKRAARGDAWLSGHVVGKAFDFDVKGMTAPEVREWLKENQDILPFPIRLERKLKGKQISWVHLDVCYEPKNKGMVYEFDI